MRIVVLVMGLILFTRLFYLQVVKHSHYNALAISEHQKKFTLPATRGTIYFRDGDSIVPAVLNDTAYTLYADPNLVTDATSVAEKLQVLFGLDQSQVKEKLEREDTAYVVLAKRLQKEDADLFQQAKNELKGVNVAPVPQRTYPEGRLGAQVLGFVNDEGQGQYGVESALHKKLAGEPGQLKAITDVHGIPLSLDDATNIAKQPKNGENIALTIDRNIQAKAEEALANGLKASRATKGSVVVLDPHTGAVRAMANAPDFDPAQYYAVEGNAYEKFQNRVVSDAYEAGSVIKVLTMAVGLNEGVVQKDSRFYNSGAVQIDDARITNVEQGVNGSRSMTDVIVYSLNTGVIHVLSQLGGGSLNVQARERLYDYFTDRFGFGSLTGIEQTGESMGSIYGPRTVQGNNVRYSNMVFGQGMNVTMLQTAAAFASVVNGGNYYQPHVVEGTVDEQGELRATVPEPERTDVVSSATSSAIMEMSREALKGQRYIRPGYNVGGKTGTSQTIDPETGKYRDNKTIGSFLGFGGDEKARYVIMVRVDDSNLGAGTYSGSAAAAPIFGDISNWLIDYYAIQPM